MLNPVAGLRPRDDRNIRVKDLAVRIDIGILTRTGDCQTVIPPMGSLERLPGAHQTSHRLGIHHPIAEPDVLPILPPRFKNHGFSMSSGQDESLPAEGKNHDQVNNVQS
jgi:hypothetical protein